MACPSNFKQLDVLFCDTVKTSFTTKEFLKNSTGVIFAATDTLENFCFVSISVFAKNPTLFKSLGSSLPCYKDIRGSMAKLEKKSSNKNAFQ